MAEFCKADKVETWGRLLKKTCSERVKTGIDTVRNAKHGFCLERAYAEMEAYKNYPDVPRVLLRARIKILLFTKVALWYLSAVRRKQVLLK